MKRRRFLQHSSAALALSMVPALRAMALNEPDFVMNKIRRKVGYFTARGGAIVWFIHKKAIAVVDAQFPEQASMLIGEIEKRQSHPIDLLINTHHHGDHTAGNLAFKGKVGQIVAHENAKRNQATAAEIRGIQDKQVYADTLYTDTWTRDLGPEQITLRYFGRAHTSGDTVVHFERANVVHVGDLIFHKRFPYIDVSAGASARNWIEVLDQVSKTFDRQTRFVFGHSFQAEQVLGNMDDVLRTRDFIGNMLAFVEKKLQAGTSLDEILKTEQIPGSEEFVSMGLHERTLRAVVEEIQGE